MGWTTPATWAVEKPTATKLNTHVRDNLTALRTANKTTTAVATANVSFSTSEATIISTSYVFDAAGTYLIEGSLYAWTAVDTTPVTTDLILRVNGNQVGASKDRNAGTTSIGEGMTARALVSGVSGSLSVTLKIISSAGTGHTANAGSTYPAILTITPADVV